MSSVYFVSFFVYKQLHILNSKVIFVKTLLVILFTTHHFPVQVWHRSQRPVEDWQDMYIQRTYKKRALSSNADLES